MRFEMKYEFWNMAMLTIWFIFCSAFMLIKYMTDQITDAPMLGYVYSFICMFLAYCYFRRSLEALEL